MNNEGPSLEHLLRRVTETPSDFLAEPRTESGSGVVHVDAVIADLFALYNAPLPALAEFTPDSTQTSRRRVGVALLLSWLLADPEMLQQPLSAPRLQLLLTDGAAELAAQLAPAKYCDEPDRREELVRFALARLDLRPSGETLPQAQDRLVALNSAERARVVAAARQAEERARAVREALAKKAAQEAADKYTRE